MHRVRLERFDAFRRPAKPLRKALSHLLCFSAKTIGTKRPRRYVPVPVHDIHVCAYVADVAEDVENRTQRAAFVVRGNARVHAHRQSHRRRVLAVVHRNGHRIQGTGESSNGGGEGRPPSTTCRSVACRPGSRARVNIGRRCETEEHNGNSFPSPVPKRKLRSRRSFEKSSSVGHVQRRVFVSR